MGIEIRLTAETPEEYASLVTALAKGAPAQRLSVEWKEGVFAPVEAHTLPEPASRDPFPEIPVLPSAPAETAGSVSEWQPAPEETAEPEAVKRPRGRPRKEPAPEPEEIEVGGEVVAEILPPEPPLIAEPEQTITAAMCKDRMHAAIRTGADAAHRLKAHLQSTYGTGLLSGVPADRLPELYDYLGKFAAGQVQ